LTAEERDDRFRELEEAYKDYTVYDQHYEKIGKVDDLFVDETDTPEYIGVKTGFLGMKSTLIPMELVRVNDRRKLIEVAASSDTIKEAPTFGDDKEITPDYEDRVHTYFGLETVHSHGDRTSYGGYYASEAHRDEDLSREVDTEYGERAEPEVDERTPSGGERSGPYFRGTEPGLSDVAAQDQGRTESEDRPGVTFGGERDAFSSGGRSSEPEGTSQSGGERRAEGMRIYKRSRRSGV
jgi:hypothetical protein